MALEDLFLLNYAISIIYVAYTSYNVWIVLRKYIKITIFFTLILELILKVIYIYDIYSIGANCQLDKYV